MWGALRSERVLLSGGVVIETRMTWCLMWFLLFIGVPSVLGVNPFLRAGPGERGGPWVPAGATACRPEHTVVASGPSASGGLARGLHAP